MKSPKSNSSSILLNLGMQNLPFLSWELQAPSEQLPHYPLSTGVLVPAPWPLLLQPLHLELLPPAAGQIPRKHSNRHHPPKNSKSKKRLPAHSTPPGKTCLA